MNKLKSLLLVLFLGVLSLQGQDLNDKVLFTINGEKAYVSEFMESYNRNLDLISDPKQRSLDVNLELYESYRAKLQQARELGLDTISEYKNEVEKYRNQLAESYFNDPVEQEKLLKEAYERSKYELNVSHILLLVKEDATKAEKEKAIKKLESISKDIQKGKISFEEAALKYSEDPSAKYNSGNLNWMSVFYMLYPFETAAYNLNVGEISKPVQTSYGYHLLKLNDKRDSKGKVQIAHIVKLYIPGKDRDSLDSSYKNLLDSIANEVNNGKEFGELARQFSDDKRSGMNGGNVPAVGSGKLLPVMDKFAFSTEEGKLSESFKSDYGWHILKVNKKYPILSYEESREDLLKELKRDSRNDNIEKSIVSHLKKKYQIDIVKSSFEKFESTLDSNSVYSKADIKSSDNKKIVLKVEDKAFTVQDYIDFINSNPLNNSSKLSFKYNLSKLRNDFIDQSVLNYYEENLENEFPEFKSLMNNYREGILVYNLMNNKIWGKSYIDTTGLQNFYQKNKENYMWPQRANVLAARCFTEEAAKKAHKYMKRGWKQERIEKKMNKSSDVKLSFQKGVITPDNKVLPEGFEWKKGLSTIYKNSDNNFVIIDVLNFVEPQIKSFEEAKNKARIDYQTYLEKKWLDELKDNYKAELNTDVYQELKNTIKSE